MTLTLDLTPEQEAHLQFEAAEAGLPLNDYIRRRLLGDETNVTASQAIRLEAIDAVMGMLAGSGISSEDFMREKQDEVEREQARWQERLGPSSA